jgi:hypothetical protein
MALPASMQHGAILSLGCMGNRVYTGLREDEMHFVLRGKDLAAVAHSLTIITSANTGHLAGVSDFKVGRHRQCQAIDCDALRPK